MKKKLPKTDQKSTQHSTLHDRFAEVFAITAKDLCRVAKEHEERLDAACNLGPHENLQ